MSDTPLPLDEAATLRARVAELEKQRDEANKLRSGCMCICGFSIAYNQPITDDELRRVRGLMLEHDAVCESNPMHTRVAELEKERGTLVDDNARLWAMVHERDARANALRDALAEWDAAYRAANFDTTEGCGRLALAMESARAALASTPAADLAAYRKSVLEEAAKMLDERASACGSKAPVSATVYRTCSSEVSALAAQEVKP